MADGEGSRTLVGVDVVELSSPTAISVVSRALDGNGGLSAASLGCSFTSSSEFSSSVSQQDNIESVICSMTLWAAWSSSQIGTVSISLGEQPRFRDLDLLAADDGGGNGPLLRHLANVRPLSKEFVFTCPRFLPYTSAFDGVELPDDFADPSTPFPFVTNKLDCLK